MPNTASTSDLEALLARVEKATGPDRELDVAIRLALFPPAGRPAWLPYTASLDACQALQEQLLPKWSWSVMHRHGESGPYAVARTARVVGDDVQGFDAVHDKAPLAWLAAILSALIARSQEHGQ